MLPKVFSPLRYPGGKSSFSVYIEAFIREYMLLDCTLIEPYAGGASISLAMLSRGVVGRIVLAESDPLLFAFWRSVFGFPDDLCDLIERTPVNLATWYELQDYLREDPIAKYGLKRSGLACLFLNRMNFSGIIHAKPIGGVNQKSRYKIDCRFNKERIIDLILEISKYRNQVEIVQEDALSLLRRMRKSLSGGNCFCYIDPPYYVQGHKLYRRYYSDKDHKNLALFLSRQDYVWLVSIDDHPSIREYYSGNFLSTVRAKYTVKSKRSVDELLISNRPLLRIDSNDVNSNDVQVLARAS